MKTVFIIGSSSGIGLELVKVYLLKSYKIIAASRTATSNIKLKALKKNFEDNLFLYDIDVTSNLKMKEKIEHIFKEHSNIDLCIYNAGLYEPMSLKELDLSVIEQIHKVNFLGAVSFIKNLRPHVVNNKNTKIVLNISISSYFGLVNASAYSSSKAALLNFAQSIQPELFKENIHLSIINHGFVKTRLTAKNNFKMPQLMDAYDVAKKIYEELEKPYRFEICFPLLLTSFIKLLSLLPYKLSLEINKRLLK